MSARTGRLVGAGLLTSSIVLSAVGQLCMKVGMLELKHGAPFAVTSAGVFAQPMLWTLGGLIAYAASLLAWLAVLIRYPLSYAYPFLGLSYVLVYVGATHWTRLMEAATPLRTAGTLLIIAGVCLVSLTESRERPARRGVKTL